MKIFLLLLFLLLQLGCSSKREIPNCNEKPMFNRMHCETINQHQGSLEYVVVENYHKVCASRNNNYFSDLINDYYYTHLDTINTRRFIYFLTPITKEDFSNGNDGFLYENISKCEIFTVTMDANKFNGYKITDITFNINGSLIGITINKENQKIITFYDNNYPIKLNIDKLDSPTLQLLPK